MLDHVARDRQEQARSLGAELYLALEGFGESLQKRHYALRTVAMYRRAATHFARWVDRRRKPASRVDQALVSTFLLEHLPVCGCPGRVPRVLFTVRAALNLFLAELRERGVVDPPVSSLTALVSHALDEYDVFLRDTCGLSQATRHYRRRYIGEFLAARFGAGTIDSERLGIRDVEDFLCRRADRWSRESLHVVACSLRSWLRHQQLLGKDMSCQIAGVPRIPRWRLARLPDVLTDAEVATLLEAFDRQTPTGRRDYAIACCLADLGLRACEVALLQLDDADWRRGALRLAGGKARRVDWLPIPPRLGRAIVDYLRHGRPPTTSRALFVRHRGPLGAPIRASVVRQVMQRAAVLASLGDRWRGPHLLRHTTATRLLRRGVTLKGIADVLRHRSLDTTAIYAKVNVDALREVAMPWPGRAR